MLPLNNRKALISPELNQVRIDGEPQETVRTGFAAVLINSRDQISEPKRIPCAAIFCEPSGSVLRHNSLFRFGCFQILHIPSPDGGILRLLLHAARHRAKGWPKSDREG